MAFADSTIDHALGRLEAAVDEALTASLGTLPREQLADVACRVESRLVAKVEALRVRVASAADDAVVGIVDGVRTTDQLVSARTGVDPGRVRGDARLGRWLEHFPLFSDAFMAGTVSREHLERLRRLDTPRVHIELMASQQMFLDAARTVEWRDFDQVVGYWLIAADPDGAVPREHLRNRTFSIRKHADGSWSGRFVLDAVSGQAVRNAVAMEAQRLLDVDAEASISRTSADRAAEAFVQTLSRGATRSSGDLPTPLVHLVMGQELAEELVRKVIDGDGTPVLASQTEVGRRCEFADGTPVHPNVAVGVLAVARFVRLVLAPNSRPLDLGRSTRGFPRDLKLALLAANRGRCRTPGCDAPFAWLQIDHIHPWAKGGCTETENSDTLCGPDNRAKGAR